MSMYETLPGKILDVGSCPQCLNSDTDIVNSHLYCGHCGSFWNCMVEIDPTSGNSAICWKRTTEERVMSWDDEAYGKLMLRQMARLD